MNRKYRRKYLFEFAKEKTNYKNKFYNIWWTEISGKTRLYPHEAERRNCGSEGNNPFAD